MSKNTTATPLSEVKRFDPLAPMRDAMIQVGAAAQTLAAVRRLADAKSGAMFASVNVVASVACLSRSTVIRHLDMLVEGGWLTYRGREKRRTATYIVPRRLLRNDLEREKFAILPRWAAKLLPTWGERCVFALIVSRDRLCEWIDEGNGGANSDDPEEQGHAAAVERRVFSVATMATECGLNRETICEAKRKLVKRKLVKVDSAAWYRDDFGRCRTVADSVFLNPKFKVSIKLIDDPAAGQKLKSKPTVHRVRKLTYTQSDSDIPPCTDSDMGVVGNWNRGSRKLTYTQSDSDIRSEENSYCNSDLNSEENFSTPTTDKNSVTAAVRGDFVFPEPEKDQGNEQTDDVREINYTERRRKLVEQFKHLMAQADANGDDGAL